MLWPYAIGSTRNDLARLDAWVPRGARKLEHHAVEVPVEPATALSALAGVRLQDVPVVASLMALRGIPFAREMTLLELFGTSPFLRLDEEPGREVVFGVVGPFWDIRRGHLPARIPATPDEFRAALSDGCSAGIGNFRAEPTATGSRVWTETWVSAPGFAQAFPFVVYWLLIGPFSAWIRRLMLRAGRSRAIASCDRG